MFRPAVLLKGEPHYYHQNTKRHHDELPHCKYLIQLCQHRSHGDEIYNSVIPAVFRTLQLFPDNSTDNLRWFNINSTICAMPRRHFHICIFFCTSKIDWIDYSLHIMASNLFHRKTNLKIILNWIKSTLTSQRPNPKVTILMQIVTK